MKQIFESENISFVEPSYDLIPDYLVMINDYEHVQRLIHRTYKPREPYTEEQEINWIHERLKEKASCFSMIEKKSGDFIGNIDLHDVHDSEGELGIAITAEKQDHGYGTEAVSAITAYGMERLGLNRIVLKVNPENARALRVYQKCGFREYHRTDEHVFMEITQS